MEKYQAQFAPSLSLSLERMHVCSRVTQLLLQLPASDENSLVWGGGERTLLFPIKTPKKTLQDHLPCADPRGLQRGGRRIALYKNEYRGPRVVFVLSNRVSSLRWCGCQH
jgi:hypothetical protein